MKKLVIAMIRFYQKYISPYKGTKCPYVPSCSQYGLEAIEKYGVIEEDFWLHGEFFGAILSLKEDMILYLENIR